MLDWLGESKVADAAECAARTNGSAVPDPLPLEYGNAYGMTVRFKTRSGEAPATLSEPVRQKPPIEILDCDQRNQRDSLEWPRVVFVERPRRQRSLGLAAGSHRITWAADASERGSRREHL